MQEENYFSEALNFEHDSTSSNEVIDYLENIHSFGDNDLQDYMMANSEPNTSLANSIFHEERDLHRFHVSEASCSGANNEASSHNGQHMGIGFFEERVNDIINLDPLFVQPPGVNQPVQNVNLEIGTRVSQPSRSFEENSVRASSSVEGRRASCKRRAMEAGIGQSSSGGYRDFQHGESSSWTPASMGYRPGNGSNISGSLDHGSRGLISSTVPNFPVSAVAGRSSRNIRVRRNPSDQQETVNPTALPSVTNVRRPIAPSHSNFLRHLPEGQDLLDLRHAQTLGNVFSRNPNAPDVSIPPVSRNMLLPFQRTEGSLTGGSSNSTAPVERNLLPDETRSRNISGTPELRNMARSQSSRNVTSGNPNIASSSMSRTGVTTSVQPPSSNLAWNAYQNLPQYQRRRSEFPRRSLVSSLTVDATNQRSGYHPTLRSSASPDGLVLQHDGVNSQMHNQAYSRAGMRFDRQGDSVVEIPHSLQALAVASRGRSRLMFSQNILDAMRRDPNYNLRLEEAMLLNQSMLFGGAPSIHDRHRDMRLDVDNMSYEELLALEERIGDVCTGVNEETISNRLKQQTYKSSTRSTQEAEPCCICQEEYTEGEVLGKLECGHEFHSQCIKEWLKQKNLCPICKNTGLNTVKKQKIG